MASAWMDQGKMRRKEAIKLGREWTALGHSIRIEPLHYRDIVRAYLKLNSKEQLSSLFVSAQEKLRC